MDDFIRALQRSMNFGKRLGRLAYAEWLFVTLPVAALVALFVDHYRGVPMSAAWVVILAVWGKSAFDRDRLWASIRRELREDAERLGGTK